MSKKIVSTFSVLVFFVFVLLSCPQAPENNEKQTNPEDTRIIGIWKYAADTPPGTVYASSTAGYTAASGQTKAYKFNADKSMSDGNYTSPNFTDSTATISNAAWSVSGNILTLNYKLTSDGIKCT